jgi:hypothetical protein
VIAAVVRELAVRAVRQLVVLDLREDLVGGGLGLVGLGGERVLGHRALVGDATDRDVGACALLALGQRRGAAAVGLRCAVAIEAGLHEARATEQRRGLAMIQQRGRSCVRLVPCRGVVVMHRGLHAGMRGESDTRQVEQSRHVMPTPPAAVGFRSRR